ncbi:MAG TPA: GxxExxY protein, partial [Candidatus Sulfotelmatobacter sp.]|nr:GxxExxY protein [Candidatus Sulfotelmatobacter sp.]
MISEEIDKIASKIVNSAFKIHKSLGPGLLETVYEICFCHELDKIGIRYKRQVPVPINYEGIKFDAALRLDVLVEDL